MINVYEAERIVLGAVKLLGAERCPLDQAYGRILCRGILNDRDQPPFDKATMDGIAINHAAWQKGGRSFKIQHVLMAGDAPKVLNAPYCARIMTGAVVPKGADCVIPVERVTLAANTAHLNEDAAVARWQFIRRKGLDAKKGDVLLKAGAQLDPQAIGIAACAGKSLLHVRRRARVAVVATGNELIDVGRPIKPHQTRLSNSYALQALFEQSGLAVAARIHVPDDESVMQKRLAQVLRDSDVLVLSGGVSMGDMDYVPRVLNRLKVKQLFHKVAQKPGKPLWFGVSQSGKPVFGLPGNPVSTLVCACRYVMPYLIQAAGLPYTARTVKLNQSPSGQLAPDMVHFLPVLGNAIVSTGGSGDLISLANTDGFIAYDPNQKSLIRPYFSWRV